MDPSEWHTYTWDDEELNALKNIGLTRTGQPMDRYEFLWRALDDQGVPFVVKLMKSYSPELAALRKLRSLSSPRNIFVPGRLLECSKSCIYVMPQLPDLRYAWTASVTLRQLLDDLYKIIDMIQFMHENNMAFIDIWQDNALYSTEGFVHRELGFDIPPRSLYLIDLGSVRMLPSGPGSGIKITDWESRRGKLPPPEGKDIVDPYGYDVYMLSDLLATYARGWERAHFANPSHIPRSIMRFAREIKFLDSTKRPSVFTVRRQFSALRVWLYCTAWTYKVLPATFADTIDIYGWRFIRTFIR